MRGEDNMAQSLKEPYLETPPHAWGRLRRIIGVSENTKKHPHMRGEDPERSLNFFLHTWY